MYWKRYADIRKLYEVLHRYHQAIYRPGKFPDFPDKPRFMGIDLHSNLHETNVIFRTF